MSRITISTESLQEIVARAVAAALAEQGLLSQAAEPEEVPEQPTVTTKATKQAANLAAAKWMREKNLVPAGQAWLAVKNGERNVAKLRQLNTADGLPKAKLATEAKAEIVTQVVTEAPKAAAKTAAAKKAPAKKAPAKKAAAKKTTPARARDAKGHYLPMTAVTEQTEQALIETVTEAGTTEVPDGATVGFTASTLALMDDLASKGLNDDEIASALKAAGITA